MRPESVEKVYAYLTDTPRSARQLIALINMHRATIWGALEKLRAQGRVSHSEKGWIRTPNEDKIGR